MFTSARFKLTLFYLAIILALSITLSFGTRWLAEKEFMKSNAVQRGAYRGVITEYGFELRPDNRAFYVQRQQEEHVRNKLNEYVAIINIGALVIGGISSWLFAGWTLRPIEAAHNRQKQFASDASHELRTPLTVIRTENEVFLRQKNTSAADARAVLESNLDEIQRLERLATNLLALTQYEDAHLALEPVALHEVVTTALQTIAKQYPTATASVKVPKGTRVLGDKDSLTQLCTIILENACKYGPEHAVVTVHSEQSAHTTLLHIRDNGPGIAPKDLPFIFDRLYRGDTARANTTPGHGLGLALAKRIATANQATITAQTIPGSGAQFSIALQTAKVDALAPA